MTMVAATKHTVFTEEGGHRVGREQCPSIAAGLSLAGVIRGGLEDNFYLPDDSMARSNGDLIAAARTMAELSGRRAGDPGRDARAAGDPKAMAGEATIVRARRR